MPLVIIALEADIHTNTQTSAKKQFQETRHAPACGQHVPGLKIDACCTFTGRDAQITTRAKLLTIKYEFYGFSCDLIKTIK